MNLNLGEIEKLCRSLNDARGVLEQRVTELQSRLDSCVRRRMPGIKSAVGRVAEAQAELHAAIESHPELFERPKTRIFHGLKVGFRKGADRLEWENDDQVVALIERHFADQTDELLIVKKTPSKRALEALDAKDLKRIAVTKETGVDQVTVHAIDKDVNRLVGALVKAGVEESLQKDQEAA